MAYEWTYEDRRDTWEWLCGRWPDARGWEPDTVSAFFADLRPFAPGLVLAALAQLRDEGREFAPRSPLVVHTCREIGQQGPVVEAPALPAPPPPGSMSWAEYARTHLGADISLTEAARRWKQGSLTLEDQ